LSPFQQHHVEKIPSTQRISDAYTGHHPQGAHLTRLSMLPHQGKQLGDRPVWHQRGEAPTSKIQTVILSPSGTWVLGKTIGVGSVAKVKIAKRIEGREQVR
jgi:hypothetical protein